MSGREEVIGVLRFVDGVIRLSPEGERRIYEELHREEVRAMPYVTSWERIAMEKGLEQGLQQGRLEDAREMVLEALEIRFGELSPDLEKGIMDIGDREELRRLLRLAVQAESVRAFREQTGI